MKSTTLYHRASGGGIKVWTLTLEDDGTTLTTTWGAQGAKMQSAVDPVKPKGKENTKAFKPATVVALEKYERKINDKRAEGYVETLDDVVHSVQASTAVVTTVHGALDFNAPPKSFTPAKPHNNYRDDLARIQKLDAKGDLIKQRKRDGRRTFIFIADTVQIYSRSKMENLTDLFPDVVTRIEERVALFPDLRYTVLDTEFVVDRNGKDDFDYTGSILGADPAKSLRNQRALEAEGGSSFFYVFDVLYCKGAPVFPKPYRERHEYVETIVTMLKCPRIKAVENIAAPLDVALEVSEAAGYEGLVLWDATKGSIIQFNGKVKRVGSWKAKTDEIDEFVATHFEYGDSKFSTVVGALHIGRYDANGNWVPAGKVGGGFSEADRADALHWAPSTPDGRRDNVPVYRYETPQVVEVKYSDVSKDGKLRFPVFKRRRTDKQPEECILVDETD